MNPFYCAASSSGTSIIWLDIAPSLILICFWLFKSSRSLVKKINELTEAGAEERKARDIVLSEFSGEFYYEFGVTGIINALIMIFTYCDFLSFIASLLLIIPTVIVGYFFNNDKKKNGLAQPLCMAVICGQMSYFFISQQLIVFLQYTTIGFVIIIGILVVKRVVSVKKRSKNTKFD